MPTAKRQPARDVPDPPIPIVEQATTSAADFDGDGIADLAIGAPVEDESFLSSVGTVTILYGALFADGFETATPQLWSATAP